MQAMHSMDVLPAAKAGSRASIEGGPELSVGEGRASGWRGQRRSAITLFDLFPEEDYYAVTFSLYAACTIPREDPSQFTERVEGQVVKGDADEPVGTFVGYRLRADLAFDAGLSFFEIADAYSQDTHDYLFEVFTPDGELDPRVLELFGGEEPRFGPVLMPHTLEIDPSHRGQCLGYAVMHAFIETFEPGADLVIARAAPVNPPDVRPEDLGTAEHKAARARGVERLRRYWQIFGFVPTALDSEYLVMNLALRRPTLVQAIRRARARKSRRRSPAGRRPSGSSEQ